MIKLKKLLVSETRRKGIVSMNKYTNILMNMNSEDRKTVRRWDVREEGNIVVITLYCNIIGQGMLEYITKFVDSKHGEFKLFPEYNLIGIEIKIRAPKQI